MVGSIVVLLSMDGQNSFTKHDILGVVPGMTRAQIDKLITTRKWTCAAAASNDSIACKTDAGTLTAVFADATEPAKVSGARIELSNREKLSFDETVKSVSDQYGRKPDQISAAKISWNLAADLSLVLTQDGAFTLALTRLRPDSTPR